jgi:triosephosphate isomerase
VLIKKEIPSPVLYGGSVNSRNVYYYVQYKEIDGVLVGGASLQATEVNKMLSRISEQS